MLRIIVALVIAGCEPPATGVDLVIEADPGAVGDEAYLCFGFDAALVGGSDVGAIALDTPNGPVALHHVTLFASPSPYPDGPVRCEDMSADAVPLHVWATGGGDLVLPPDVALAVPAATVRIVVQAHALRIEEGTAARRMIRIETREGVEHRAGWLPLRAPTPALRPHHEETSASSCAVAGDLHVISTWPHMHQAGRRFVGALDNTPFITVDPWVFDRQHAYPIDVVAPAGSIIATHCTWFNPTDQTILPGPGIRDEMCGQSMVAWPVEMAHCL